ncbi:sigma-54 interaction domain-containing protein [Marinifilum caeruleilacunae]|uniref:Sigma-54-dependent Fis family transcriptional regulator n=1 Tax=Marinifilum caeruleilacunae TaxID=2499076 RepID=A0ABX1WZQ1_9BACT|nr:sigma-54 dependent transcriptional regulator [Marinifilum caeruleilacunae]NOU61633.1 sigma-54-dependent Fis family transcriptional regulator [Marinifilum caeruleilacunae]
MEVQKIKQRFGIIGNSYALNRAIDIATQVAPTDLSVLITGESGTGKEVFPQIIHQFSSRKHAPYIAVNCGAIPEGTIDSELFGHEKGAFTGALSDRKGYFEVADKGTIFLDEIGELPLSTQVRLLRVLETGEFIKVGSSKVLKTNVRVVAATNVNIPKSVKDGKFREDLYYRLNTVPISMPPLRERQEDIHLLFRKFAQDFAEKYRMPPLRLDDGAQQLLKSYRWPGNIRQLKNITEQISIIEKERQINAENLQTYLPMSDEHLLPAIYTENKKQEQSFSSEREILYQVLFDMKKDMSDLKKLVFDLMQKGGDSADLQKDNAMLIRKLYEDQEMDIVQHQPVQQPTVNISTPDDSVIQDTEVFVEESLSLEEKEIELIKKALDKHNGKRKYAAQDLGISERTLYRKIKEYDIG